MTIEFQTDQKGLQVFFMVQFYARLFMITNDLNLPVKKNRI